MTRRALQLLLLFACVFTVAYYPPPPAPPRSVQLVKPAATPPADWSLLRTRIDVQTWNVAVWTNAVQENTQQAHKPQDGNLRAQYKQAEAVPADGSIESLICSVFGDQCPRALRVARCESGLDPSAYNRSGASGLFQLLGHGAMFESHGWSSGDVFDAYKNTVVAFDLSHGGSNWSAWVCR